MLASTLLVLMPTSTRGPCGKPCVGTQDVCDSDSGKCVECVGNGDCGDEVCSAQHNCEECNVDADCKASAPRCVSHACAACSGVDTSCDGRAKALCDTAAWSSLVGQCVECTGTSYAACGAAPDTTPYVCNSAARTCTTSKEHSLGDCAPCVSDAQCQDGQLCALQSFGTPAQEVGYFCFWKKDATTVGAPAGNCDTVTPLVKAVAGVVSVDHAVSAACLSRASTCLALNDVAKSCESATAAGTPDHALCGFTHATENYTTHANQDGVCVDTDPTAGTSWKCTVPCVDVKDCKSVFTCDTAPSPDQCTL